MKSIAQTAAVRYDICSNNLSTLDVTPVQSSRERFKHPLTDAVLDRNEAVYTMFVLPDRATTARERRAT